MSFFQFFKRAFPPDPTNPNAKSLELLESTVTRSPGAINGGGSGAGQSTSLTTQSLPRAPLHAVLRGSGEVDGPFSEMPSKMPPMPPSSPSSPGENDDFPDLGDFRRRSSRSKRNGFEEDQELSLSVPNRATREPEFSSRERKASFGLISGGKLAGVGVDEDEGKTRLSFAVRLITTIATIGGGARSSLAGAALLYIFGRLFVTTAVAFHAVLDTSSCRLLLNKGVSFRKFSAPLLLLHAIVDIGINFGYIIACQIVYVGFLQEPDGTTCDDWIYLHDTLEVVIGISSFVVATRVCALFAIVGYIMFENRKRLRLCRKVSTKKRINAALEEVCHDGSYMNKNLKWIKFAWTLSLVISLSWAIGASVGCFRYIFLDSPPSSSSNQPIPDHCDPLDSTECILPFPSNFFLVEDATTDTGYRVNFSDKTLPITKSGQLIDPAVVNELDGFSTMAPILFYLPGLFEGQGKGLGGAALPTSDDVERSLGSNSTTFLFDIDSKALIPHFSEIYAENDKHPLIVMQPASPLGHNRRYGVALVGALGSKGAAGGLLKRSKGLEDLVDGVDARSSTFRQVLIPALIEAAPWVEDEEGVADVIGGGDGGGGVEGGDGSEEEGGEEVGGGILPMKVQMLFDFNTISENSQLEKLRSIRDATLGMLMEPEFEWKEEENVRVIQTVEGECSQRGNFVARTIHLELKTPWFLEHYGNGRRGSIIDKTKIENGKTDLFGNLKFSVQIPCSLKEASLDQFSGKDMNAVVEYGHGLFYSREEVMDSTFLQRMANDNGYLLVAADWRGMSMFDLPIIMKVLLADPSLFRATLDNLVQGFVAKMTMLHYVQNGMLEAEWMAFEGAEGGMMRVPVTENLEINFYGISQGGILGAGYNAMMGVTGMLQRSILGVPGTPFALIMGRSADFEAFKNVMLLNFFNTRHVKIMTSLIQMAWDTLEAGGLLAPPVNEVVPPVLIQAGYGDVEVPVVSAHILARSYDAKLLPGRPKDVFGLDVSVAANGMGESGPRSALTEVMYVMEEEQERMGAEGLNKVHFCVRQDLALQEQIVEFINEGYITDPCAADNCIRSQALC